MPIKKIVIIGPESTGKSTLCAALADHFHSLWVPEYAREYLLKHGKEYVYDDLVKIGRGQLALEDDYAQRLEEDQFLKDQGAQGASNKPLFIDTDLYVMKVWSEFVFGKCDNWILDQIASRTYDAYLLCRTDLPWSPDILREYPDLETRETLYHIYKDCLVNQETPWAEISGQGQERVDNAVAYVSRLIGQ